MTCHMTFLSRESVCTDSANVSYFCTPSSSTLKSSSMKCLVLLSLFIAVVYSLDNGLARTPPMGWLDWERFRCNVDCVNDPENCISERLFMEMADRMVADGYRDAGYEYVNIDDCWPAKERDAEGRLVADPKRFPHGIKGLAKYIHSKGLKLGIYEDFGTLTCGGYPGSEFYLQLDAQTFADWEVDLLKFDGCNSDPADMKYGYPIMGKFLNLTGRPILYSCSWPAYIVGSDGTKRESNFSRPLGAIPPYAQIAEACNTWRNYGDIQDSWDSRESNFSRPLGAIPPYAQIAEACNTWRNYGDIQDSWDSRESNFSRPLGAIPPYAQIAEACNTWRNYGDIQDSWDSVTSIVNFYGKNEGNFTGVAGPGNFNDPDMSNYSQIAASCNMWRNYGDIQDSWESVISIIKYYGEDGANFAESAGPGGFNDPDMLIVGDFSLSLAQQKSQMAMWCMMASPLFMSNDLRKMPAESKAILQNRHAIRVNQDPLGIQGTRRFGIKNLSMWTKPILPKGSVAFALLNFGTDGTPAPLTFQVKNIGPNPSGYNITEVFDQTHLGIFKPTQNMSVMVDPSSVIFAVATPLP